MFTRTKFWLAVAALTACFSYGFSLEDHSEYISQSSNSNRQKNPQAQPNFKILQAINPAFYVAFGGEINEQLSKRDIQSSFTGGAAPDSQTSEEKQTRPAIGFLGIAGYQLNEMLSFELYYAGSAWPQKNTLSETLTVDTFGQSSKSNKKAMYLQFGPRTLLALPIHKCFSPYVLAGLSFGYHRTKTTFESGGIFNAPTTGNDKTNTWHILYGQGYGIRSQLTTNFGMRLEVYTLGFYGLSSAANLIAYYSF